MKTSKEMVAIYLDEISELPLLEKEIAEIFEKMKPWGPGKPTGTAYPVLTELYFKVGRINNGD